MAKKDLTGAELVWSVDRVARLLVGISNIALIIAAIFLSRYWIIGLVLLNLNLVFTSVTGACLFQKFLKSIGFKEREELLQPDGKKRKEVSAERSTSILQENQI